MSLVYVVEDGAKIGIEAGTINVYHKNGGITKVPKETVEAISIFGKSQVTTQCVQFCLRQGVRISFFSKTGSYFGCLISTGHIHVQRQRNQVHLSEDKGFCVEISKKIVECKINNQLVVAKRYLRNSGISEEEQLFQIGNARKKVMDATSIDQIMGYEGIASRNYFDILSAVVDESFSFKGRNRRPPRDPFNSMLSLGYSLIMYELYGELENHGLNPYFGFLHQDKEKHPTLASDMMEEWRPVLVDSMVMSLIQGHEINKEDFYYEESGACFLKPEGLKIFQRILFA